MINFLCSTLQIHEFLIASHSLRYSASRERTKILSWFNYAHASKLQNWLFLNIILFFFSFLPVNGGNIIIVIRSNAINFLIWRKKMLALMGAACRWTLTTRNFYSNYIVNFFWHLTTKWESAKWEKVNYFHVTMSDFFLQQSHLILLCLLYEHLHALILCFLFTS